MSVSGEDALIHIGIFLMMGSVLAMCVAFGIALGRTKIQLDAIDSGHAEWITTEAGTRVFHWKNKPTE